MDNRGLCVGNTVTSGRTERGSVVHKETETESNGSFKGHREGVRGHQAPSVNFYIYISFIISKIKLL